MGYHCIALWECDAHQTEEIILCMSVWLVNPSTSWKASTHWPSKHQQIPTPCTSMKPYGHPTEINLCKQWTKRFKHMKKESIGRLLIKKTFLPICLSYQESGQWNANDESILKRYINGKLSWPLMGASKSTESITGRHMPQSSHGQLFAFFSFYP